MRQDIRRQAGGEGYRRGWAEKPVGAELRNTRGRGCDDAMCEEAHTLSTQPPTSNLRPTLSCAHPPGRLDPEVASFFELFVFCLYSYEIDFTNCVTFEPNRTERARGPCRVHAERLRHRGTW